MSRAGADRDRAEHSVHDHGSRAVIGGLAREFYQRVKKHYEGAAAWKQKRALRGPLSADEQQARQLIAHRVVPTGCTQNRGFEAELQKRLEAIRARLRASRDASPSAGDDDHAE